MNYDWPTFFASIGGSAVVGLGAAYTIVQTFFKKKIEAEVQSKYDEALANLNAKNLQELEGFKAGYKKVLDENQIRFSKLYAEQADATKELYERMSKLNNSLLELTSPLKKLPESIEKRKEFFAKLDENAVDAHNECIEFFSTNEILLPKKLCTKLSSFFRNSRGVIVNYQEGSHYSGLFSGVTSERSEAYGREFINEAYKTVQDDLKPILEELKEDFRAILNGEEQ